MNDFEMLAGRFALEREVGSGGMARVYVGRDDVLGRPVAVKVLRPSLAGTETSERFRREGSMAARLSHPNIVPVYDAGVAELDGHNVSYIVMEFVTGGDLKDRIRREGKLDAGDVCRIGAGAADALAHAHLHGIIHRDVKPHNILLDAAGAPKLTDFGIARALEGTHHTRTGNFLGTALYSAPEQLRGAEISGKTDVYSLGTALYEAATGEPPFAGTVVEVAEKHFYKTPIRPRTSERLADTILACLEKNPEDRPASDELAERLAEVAGDSQVAAIPPPPLQKERPVQRTATMGTFTRRRRSRKPLAFVCVVALLVLGGAGIYLSGYDLPGGGEEQAASQNSSRSASQAADQDASQNVAQNSSQSGSQSESQSESQNASQNVASNGGSGNSSNQTSENGFSGSGSESGSREDAAVGAVRELYQTAADEDYDRSYALLSEEFRTAVAPTREEWTGQFETLESVRFVGTPRVEVIGDTATVSGETVAIHSNRTDRTDAVWTLIREDREWKLDDLLAQPSA